MTIERAVRLLAGSILLISLALFLIVGAPALWLALFVGLNLTQSAFTGFCPAESIFRRLGVGTARDRRTEDEAIGPACASRREQP